MDAPYYNDNFTQNDQGIGLELKGFRRPKKAQMKCNEMEGDLATKLFISPKKHCDGVGVFLVDSQKEQRKISLK